MPQLAKKDSQALLGRFNGFNDAVIKSIDISCSKSAARNVRFKILTRDEMAKERDGWSIVELSLNEVGPFCFQEDVHTTAYDVLSNGLFICWFTGNVGIELGYLTSEPKSELELTKSRLYALGKTIEWDIKGDLELE